MTLKVDLQLEEGCSISTQPLNLLQTNCIGADRCFAQISIATDGDGIFGVDMKQLIDDAQQSKCMADGELKSCQIATIFHLLHNTLFTRSQKFSYIRALIIVCNNVEDRLEADKRELSRFSLKNSRVHDLHHKVSQLTCRNIPGVKGMPFKQCHVHAFSYFA